MMTDNLETSSGEGKQIACPRCGGSGTRAGVQCDLCLGTGKIDPPVEINVGDRGGAKERL